MPLNLQEARQRFDAEKEQRAKEREEQIELEEKRKREIFLNGGYIDCATPGCDGQATGSGTNYLCKPCFERQNAAKAAHPDLTASRHGNSQFYVSSAVADAAAGDASARSQNANARASMEVSAQAGAHAQLARARFAKQQTVSFDAPDRCPMMRVKLPPPSGEGAVAVGAIANGGQLCRSPGCDFFGTAELNYMCSKCYSRSK